MEIISQVAQNLKKQMHAQALNLQKKNFFQHELHPNAKEAKANKISLNLQLIFVEYKGSSPLLEKLINQPVCSEEREEEYERAKRRIFNEMMSPAPHYKYSISLGGTKVGDVLLLL
jgi:hypothetical protein